jgi:tRNA(Ile)-lysidine synthase
MTDLVLNNAIAAVPAGAWAVGVSGGADSVAVLGLLRDRTDLRLIVVHLDHQTRGDASTGDAAFVTDLADSLGLPSVIARRSEIEPVLADKPSNASALYRACRLALFRRVVAERRLDGVILAHHADDQAETVLQRLLRGSPPAGLAGMARRSVLAGVTVLRPMLGVRRAALQKVLVDRGLSHRDDASNASDDYLRNRLRKLLVGREDLTLQLLQLAEACGDAKTWIAETSPLLAPSFRVGDLADLPAPLGRESARKWLISRGSPADDLSGEVLERLIRMAADAATPASLQFPGRVTVHRRRGMVSAGNSDIIGPDGSP